MKVYVHVPFCHSKCAYCDFYSSPHKELMERYVEAVGNEWSHIAPDGCVPDTLYLGGGTPSSLPTHLLERLIAKISHGERMNLREFTIEANPDDVTDRWARHIAGNTQIDRVSMGIQTFDDSRLRFLGRRHTSRQAEDAFYTLRVAGIGNISCDLIYGLPGQTFDDWRDDLDRLIALRPEHISAYLLSYEPKTRLGVMLSKGMVTEVPDTLADKMYGYLCQATAQAGYEHYEISNFALKGHRAIHNSSYWDGSEYIGLGPGAHSMAVGVRWYNQANLKLYVDSRGLETRAIDEEDDKNRFNDMIITALRTADGLDPARVPERFTENFNRNVSRLSSKGLLQETDQGHIIIPESHWLTSNSILLELIEI